MDKMLDSVLNSFKHTVETEKRGYLSSFYQSVLADNPLFQRSSYETKEKHDEAPSGVGVGLSEFDAFAPSSVPAAADVVTYSQNLPESKLSTRDYQSQHAWGDNSFPSDALGGSAGAQSTNPFGDSFRDFTASKTQPNENFEQIINISDETDNKQHQSNLDLMQMSTESNGQSPFPMPLIAFEENSKPKQQDIAGDSAFVSSA